VATDGADFSIDPAELAKTGDVLVRRHLAAGTRTVASVTRRLEQKLEDATQRSVPGELWKAWSSKVYPKNSGPAKNPVGTLFLKGRNRTYGAIAFWTEPGAIRGREGQHLAIPLPAAGPRGRDRLLTPLEWETAHNTELRFVARPGKPALLVADDAVLSGRAQIAKRNSDKRMAKGRGSATVPIFVLLPLVKHRNAFAIAPIVDASEGEMAQAFLLAVRELGRR
jgi:hypothetical protein